ncbi:E3 ubiquitin-protein ligase MIB1-like isoform X2 [Octopus vulgaris]|uniref:E3 ubiquitin-protein ligase MIB1-like isoform X2 n=1 Tax=Octopus vulgaris TaxID=6645 RepID=A0AA36HHP8_OCTVU|nr:E3 ubiquitin-protein ligase MIB1-like isoform X2 [Octopus vulgaris]
MREKKEGDREKRKGEGKRGEKRKNSHLEAVELLLSRESNINGKCDDGWTPLHCAAAKNWTDGVAFLLKQTDVEVNPRDKDGRTPLHLACLLGDFHTVDILLGHNGIDAYVVNNDGDTPLHVAVRSCLHLAVEREVFDSEDAPLDLLNECCTALNLKIEERLSGIVIARYLASQGADFHHKNNNNNTPLDLIKDPNLRRKLETCLPPQCLLCRNKEATTKVHPCEHLLTCEECSNVALKRCLRCLKPVTSRGRVEAPKFEDRCVQTEAICQELGAASQAIEAPKFEDRCVQTEAICQELGAASQAIGEYKIIVPN